MRRVIRKRIRRRDDGVDLALDLNAVIAINSGREDEDDGPVDRASPGEEPAGKTGNDQGRKPP